MDLLAGFFRALNEEVARAGVQKKQLATALGLSASSVTEMFTSGRGGNKTPPSWERVERILRFCWAKRDYGEFPGMTDAAVTRAVRDVQTRLQDWRIRHAMLVRDMERARERLVATSQVNVMLPLPAMPEVRYSLPPDATAFTGRGEELSQVTTTVASAGGVVVVRAIDGMPGVGKTALAVHAAHVLRDRFPDRQLFIDLHAHSPGREPVRPEDALAGLLAAAGVDPRFLPGNLDERAAMWRDRMVGKRALVVLDNAASTSQVAPLLPGEGGCLVLVTSRRHLGDLPGAVTPVLLDVLPPRQAQEMFTRLAPRAADSPSEVAEMVRLAGFLPLAISLLARLFRRHRSWTLADLAAETRECLLKLTVEHETISAAFEMSYRHLDPTRRRFFSLLGLHPGTATDDYAAAALAGTSLEEAAGLLDGLHSEGLLTEVGHRRCGMHDLLRRYASDRAVGIPADSLQQALEQLLDYYQHSAASVDAGLARQTQPGRSIVTPARLLAAPDLDDPSQMLMWARAERANLLACLDHAIIANQDARVVTLTAALVELLRRDGPWADAITRLATAVEAAQRLGDRLAQANALNCLGTMRRLMGDYPDAARAMGQALDIYRDLDDRLGQANSLGNLGDVRLAKGDYQGAAQALEQALGVYRDIGDRRGQANALSNLGDVRRLTGDYPRAVQALEQALGIYRDIGDRRGQANSLLFLGGVRRLTGDYQGAAQALEQALGIYRDIGDRLGRANALNNLGTTWQATGDFPAAAQAHEQAMDIYHDIGARHGQANALFRLGAVVRLTGDYPGAVQALEKALVIYRDIGDQRGQANALSKLGDIQRLTGDYHGAGQTLEQTLAIYRDLGDRGGEAEALNERGTLYRVSGDIAKAEQCHQRALELARAIAGSWDEAHALVGLGRCALAAGHAAQAGVLLRQALQIFKRISAAEVPDLLAELDALTGPEHAH